MFNYTITTTFLGKLDKTIKSDATRRMKLRNLKLEDYLDNLYVLIFIIINIFLQQLQHDKKLIDFRLNKRQLGVQVVQSLVLVKKKDLIEN